jgi:pimeloyl-ACP methyl ester carboxylesterase
VSDHNGDRPRGGWIKPFLAGMVATGAGWVIAETLAARRSRIDRRLVRRPGPDDDVAPVVIVPGIMGSGLHRADGTQVWLNLRNAVGQYNLGLPFTVPLAESRDELIPGALLGAEAMMPRLFGFTEYYDLIEMLELVGFRASTRGERKRAVHHVFAYDWRRDLVESARRLDATLEELAGQEPDWDGRFNLVGHSMGGLVARYYLRYGTAEPAPDQPVTWAGAKRIRNLILVATPSGGSLPALEGLLFGNRVGLSYTTLAAPVIARMPSVYQLIPPAGTKSLLDQELEPLEVDLHDVETWKRFGWGPFASKATRLEGLTSSDLEAYPSFVEAALARARAFHDALARTPRTPCPVRVSILGGDCLPTLARGVLSGKDGHPPRFEPRTRREAEAMLDAGDGRVTRASLLASHLPWAEDHVESCGIPEASEVFVGSADHHGIYREPTFQSILMRMLLRRPRPRPAELTAASHGSATGTEVTGTQASATLDRLVPTD